MDGLIDPAGNRPDLLFFNRALPGSATDNLMQYLKARTPDLTAFSYAIAEHIDQIFISLTGVKAGYIFRRRVPGALLEPVQDALRQEKFSAELTAQKMATVTSLENLLQTDCHPSA